MAEHAALSFHDVLTHVYITYPEGGPYGDNPPSLQSCMSWWSCQGFGSDTRGVIRTKAEIHDRLQSLVDGLGQW
jgi:hypothetical protein